MNIAAISHNASSRRMAVLISLCGVMFAGQCIAQSTWKPDRPVEIVVGSAAGGGNDKTGRTLLKIWQENKWLENAAVVNKVGGGGALAYTYTNQTPGDGHRIAVARTGLLTNHIQGLSPLNYTDMTPIAMIADDPMSLTVRADSTMKSVKDLVARWKADPQSVSISLGSSRGSTTHFLVAQIAKLSGVDARRLKVLTFGGGADSTTNLLGGHIDMVALGPGNVVTHHKAGTLRIIAVASEKRMALVPDVPTVKEQGFDVVQGGWTLMVGPKDLTPAQVAYWENLLERTVNHPEWKRSLQEDSAEWLFMKTQPTREFLRREYDTDRALLIELGMVK
jgi:putative tricarboxylic transport membrane protein